jgi:hypothetical protein
MENPNDPAWIDFVDTLPAHMQRVRVWVEGEVFSGYINHEWLTDAVWIKFEESKYGKFFDIEDLEDIRRVTKWKPIEMGANEQISSISVPMTPYIKEKLEEDAQFAKETAGINPDLMGPA